jgi:hypothetical protein
MDKNTKGFPSDATNIGDPKTRLEPSVSVSSIKFFEDSPQTLVVGIKAQGLRIHDLRGKFKNRMKAIYILTWSLDNQTLIALSRFKQSATTTSQSIMLTKITLLHLPSIILV